MFEKIQGNIELVDEKYQLSRVSSVIIRLILKHCALFKVSNCNMTTVIVEVVAFGVTGGK